MLVVFVAIFWREDYRGGRNAVTHDCRSNTEDLLVDGPLGCSQLSLCTKSFKQLEAACLDQPRELKTPR